MDKKPRCRPFQFRLRTFILIVAIAAVQCAVCLPMLREWQSRRELERKLQEVMKLMRRDIGSAIESDS
jgi:hypothetical protein